MRNLLSILVFLYMVSCGDDRYIDPALAPYYEEYLALCDSYEACAKKPRREITRMEFVHKLSGDVDGLCKWEKNLSGTQTYIKMIRKPEDMSEFRYKGIVFHELGHCVHKLKHDSNSLIMSHEVMAKLSNWEDAINEFFTNQMR